MTTVNLDNTVVINGILYIIVKSSAIIEAESKRGRKFWQGHVLRSPTHNFFTASSAWQDNGKGSTKVIWSTPYRAEPTNVGRANERSNEEQAYFELDSMVNKQTDKRNSEKPLPMLAHTYSKRKHDITYPAAVQPKYDGMRVLYDGEVAWSRGNKEIIAEVFAHLHFSTDGHIIDGELILPGNVKVNETMKAAKKFRAGVSTKLLYRVYDIVDETLTFAERFAILERLVRSTSVANIILARTEIAVNEAAMLRYHADFTSEGFEGTIIRNLNGKYEINKRSAELQKHKDFVDAEYEIVDIVEAGGGSSEGVGKFICKTEDGTLFESTATGTIEERREYLTNRLAYIGKFAKVKYREMSGKNNVPFHSNVLEIRDTKDGGH